MDAQYNRTNNIMFSNKYCNRFACFWPKGYQLGSLGKSHQNGDYLKQAMRKIVFPQESNLQPLDYRSTALPLELEKTPPRMQTYKRIYSSHANVYPRYSGLQTSKNILIDLLLQTNIAFAFLKWVHDQVEELLQDCPSVLQLPSTKTTVSFLRKNSVTTHV